MSRPEFRAVSVPARDVAARTSIPIPAPKFSAWKTVAEVAGLVAVALLAVGIWVIA